MSIPAACLILVITAIFGAGQASVQAQPLRSAQPAGSLVFSTYLGGSTPCVSSVSPHTFAQNAASDAQGNTYVTGGTQVSDLPVLHAHQPSPAKNSTMSAFVAKYNTAGQPLWCTYLGGNNQSMGIGVAAMPTGGVAVMGITTSDARGPFPTLHAYQPHNNGLTDYFVTVFDANGKLQYSTCLGGSGVEAQSPPFSDNSNNGNGVAVDAAGLVYVAGMTTSSGDKGTIKFPVTANALQSNLAGTRNACLCIIDPTQSGQGSLVYSSFLGGDHDNQGHSVAVDAAGSLITVAGFTTSCNFPTTANAYRRSAPPGCFGPNSSNGFVTQIRSSQPGSPSSQYTMRYSTYLGADSSTARDDVYGMTVTPTGLIVATGRTESANFPMTAGGPTIFNSAPYLHEDGGDEPFLVKIDPSLNGTASLVYSTFLGGLGSFATSVGVDARGAVYVGGETTASGAAYVPGNKTAPQTFPYTPNALFTALPDTRSCLFMQISPGGATLGYSTYLGGQDNTSRTYGLAVDPTGNVVLSGLTFSSEFPTKNAAQPWPGNTRSQNAFVTKFSFAPSAQTGPLLLLLLAD